MPVEFKEDSIKEWIINNLEEGQIADVILEGCPWDRDWETVNG